MYTLNVLLIAAAAAYAIAGPSGPKKAVEEYPPRPPSSLSPVRRLNLNEFILPQLMMPGYLGYEDVPQMMPQPESTNDWIHREIAHIKEIENESEDETPNPYDMEQPGWIPAESYVARPYDGPLGRLDVPNYVLDSVMVGPQHQQAESRRYRHVIPYETAAQRNQRNHKEKPFALTPLDKGYYEPVVTTDYSGAHHEGGETDGMPVELPRKTRQNPNLSRGRTLVTEDLDRLRTHAYPKTTPKTSDDNINIIEAAGDPAESIFGVALIATVGMAMAMAIVGFALGWYTLSKKAKAAADVDYPAYGVTGPTVDMSGDRKLAHSAHMYHYQHQKQQIIAMERGSSEHRDCSVSDPESEEENPEGDYTVYECPGFATTGDMEVKNPMFSQDPTPATPGKCEVVKPQPKE